MVIWGMPREPLDITWQLVEDAGGVIMAGGELADAVDMMASLVRDL